MVGGRVIPEIVGAGTAFDVVGANQERRHLVAGHLLIWAEPIHGASARHASGGHAVDVGLEGRGIIVVEMVPLDGGKLQHPRQEGGELAARDDLVRAETVGRTSARYPTRVQPGDVTGEDRVIDVTEGCGGLHRPRRIGTTEDRCNDQEGCREQGDRANRHEDPRVDSCHTRLPRAGPAVCGWMGPIRLVRSMQDPAPYIGVFCLTADQYGLGPEKPAPLKKVPVRFRTLPMMRWSTASRTGSVAPAAPRTVS